MDLITLHKTLEAAGLRVCGINSDGVISWINPPSAKDIQAAQSILVENPITEKTPTISTAMPDDKYKGRRISELGEKDLASIVETLAIRSGVADASGTIR